MTNGQETVLVLFLSLLKRTDIKLKINRQTIDCITY